MRDAHSRFLHVGPKDTCPHRQVATTFTTARESFYVFRSFPFCPTTPLASDKHPNLQLHSVGARPLRSRGETCKQRPPFKVLYPCYVQILSLASNKISDLCQLKYLTACTSLIDLNISDNPVTDGAFRIGFDLRPFLLFLLPRLQR